MDSFLAAHGSGVKRILMDDLRALRARIRAKGESKVAAFVRRWPDRPCGAWVATL